MSILSKNLRSLREEKGWPPEKVAELLSLPVQEYGSYEEGLADPPASKLVALADVFSVSLDWLCGRSERRTLWVSRKN